MELRSCENSKLFSISTPCQITVDLEPLILREESRRSKTSTALDPVRVAEELISRASRRGRHPWAAFRCDDHHYPGRTYGVSTMMTSRFLWSTGTAQSGTRDPIRGRSPSSGTLSFEKSRDLWLNKAADDQRCFVVNTSIRLDSPCRNSGGGREKIASRLNGSRDHARRT